MYLFLAPFLIQQIDLLLDHQSATDHVTLHVLQ